MVTLSESIRPIQLLYKSLYQKCQFKFFMLYICKFGLFLLKYIYKGSVCTTVPNRYDLKYIVKYKNLRHIFFYIGLISDLRGKKIQSE